MKSSKKNTNPLVADAPSSEPCEVCFERFYSESYEKKDITEGNEHHFYMKVFCCLHPICSSCVYNIVQSTAFCPWCKRKWVGRSMFKKCIDVTPVLASDTHPPSEVEASSIPLPYINGALGDGL